MKHRFMLCAIFFLIITTISGCSNRQEQYNAAMNNFDAGDYDSAIIDFTNLGDYLNSTEMINRSRYLKAINEFNSGNYEISADIFQSLNSYMDSSDYLFQIEVLIAGKSVMTARESVINKYTNSWGVTGTAKFIERIYRKYPTDNVISNLYFYTVSLESYEYYEKLGYDDWWLQTAYEYARKVDPSYTGELSGEIIPFITSLLGASWSDQYKIASEQEKNYLELNKIEKEEIKNYIQDQFNHYDARDGKYTGDKYSDVIMADAAAKFGLSELQVNYIWGGIE